MTSVELHLSHAQLLRVSALVRDVEEEHIGAGSAMMVWRFSYFPTERALMEIEAEDDLSPL